MNAIGKPSVLTVFVVGVDNREQAINADARIDCAYGIFFDNTRYSSYNSSMSPVCMGSDFAWEATAAEHGILQVLFHGPLHQGLVIETDNRTTASAIKNEILARHHGSASREESQSASATRISRIVDLIELRTKRGESFVEVINSSHDPTAKKGLATARDLALKALPKTPMPLERPAGEHA